MPLLHRLCHVTHALATSPSPSSRRPALVASPCRIAFAALPLPLPSLRCLVLALSLACPLLGCNVMLLPHCHLPAHAAMVMCGDTCHGVTCVTTHHHGALVSLLTLISIISSTCLPLYLLLWRHHMLLTLCTPCCHSCEPLLQALLTGWTAGEA
jgi:hypothetical protein